MIYFVIVKLPESVIEYIDPLEQSFSMIAMNDKQLNDINSNFYISIYTSRNTPKYNFWNFSVMYSVS